MPVGAAVDVKDDERRFALLVDIEHASVCVVLIAGNDILRRRGRLLAALKDLVELRLGLLRGQLGPELKQAGQYLRANALAHSESSFGTDRSGSYSSACGFAVTVEGGQVPLRDNPLTDFA